MLFAPKALSTEILSDDVLKEDKKQCRHFGHSGLGKRAVYLGNIYFSRCRYVPLARVDRVFKRLAVSKGADQGKVFGTLPYLVVQYDGGQEKQCLFKIEQDVDDFLEAFRQENPNIPVGKAKN